jgi:hypothetical protein
MRNTYLAKNTGTLIINGAKKGTLIVASSGKKYQIGEDGSILISVLRGEVLTCENQPFFPKHKFYNMF